MSGSARKVQSLVREERNKQREKSRSQVLERRRFGSEDGVWTASPFGGPRSLRDVLNRLKSCQFRDKSFLQLLKDCLAAGDDSPDDFFRADGALAGLVGLLQGDPDFSVLATQVVANLSPLEEKNGVTLARATGIYLVTQLSSSSDSLKEASCVAIGNLALSGPRVVRVLINQEAVSSLLAMLESSEAHSSRPVSDAIAEGPPTYYALYHILHSQADLDSQVLLRIVDVSRRRLSFRCPVELHWVLFVLSCNPSLHTNYLCTSSLIHKALDVCTYEIFQKSDSRPLVKIVTPIVRLLANLCAGPSAEAASLAVLRYPDLQAILMALLATNYSHLSKETLWLVSNVVNIDSVLVHEELVELDFLDRMEFHTSQAIQKLDPFMACGL